MTCGGDVIGILPMSLGLGEGAEQNAPLGRAVIGGLFMATIARYYLSGSFQALFGTPRSGAQQGG